MNDLAEYGIGEVPDVDTNAPAAAIVLRETFGLNEFKEPTPDDGQALIHDRFLGRSGSILFVGPTGHGKSVFAIQAGILWSIGKPCFGLRASAPLRVLYVQAENDAGDIYEIRQGIYEGLEILPSERQTVGNNFRVATINDAVGTDFLNRDLRPLLASERPDLLILDPLLAYLGGDITRQDVVSVFVRSGLQRAIAEAKCGLLLVHHPAKPRADKPEAKANDDAYFGAGSADLANWARAIIVLKPTTQHGIYNLRLAKRGRKAGWMDADNVTPCIERTIAHGKGGLVYWREVEASEVFTACPVDNAKADLLALVPSASPLAKDALISRAKSARNIGEKRARGLIEELLDESKLFEWSIPRPRTLPKKLLAREPQPQPETK